MSILRYSPFKPGDLSVQERKILKKLTAAAESISFLYDSQKNPRYAGANFYPSNATLEELEKAGKSNPEILSPYTFVKRDTSGGLIAIPYRVRFQKELQKVAALLREAAALTAEKPSKAYLKARADDLLIDHYDRSNIAWLKTEKSKVGFIIGPFDRYIDKIFFQKRAYMAWLGVLDESTTREMERFKTTLLVSERKYLSGAKWVKVSKVNIRVEDTILFSGLVADFPFTGNTLPSSADLHLHKKYGSIFTIFKPIVRERFSRWIYPIFQNLFSQEIQQRYPREKLEAMFLQSSVIHHACHSLMRYTDATSRLGGYFPYFDELYTDLLGIKGCTTLLLKGAFTNEEIEMLILITICHGLYYYGALKKFPHLEQFTQGHAILFYFLLSGKALQKSKKRFRIDFHRALMVVNQLSSIVEYYMALGKRNEASEFLKKFPIQKTFRDFNKYIPKGEAG
ncbi:MAG: hypothetical protein Q7S62_00095 [bacterium]|nr:hypothetical protein [bacterium]